MWFVVFHNEDVLSIRSIAATVQQLPFSPSDSTRSRGTCRARETVSRATRLRRDGTQLGKSDQTNLLNLPRRRKKQANKSFLSFSLLLPAANPEEQATLPEPGEDPVEERPLDRSWLNLGSYTRCSGGGGGGWSSPGLQSTICFLIPDCFGASRVRSSLVVQPIGRCWPCLSESPLSLMLRDIGCPLETRCLVFGGRGRWAWQLSFIVGICG
jgi:hypothetical protein